MIFDPAPSLDIISFFGLFDAEDAALRYWLGPKQKRHDDEI